MKGLIRYRFVISTTLKQLSWKLNLVEKTLHGIIFCHLSLIIIIWSIIYLFISYFIEWSTKLQTGLAFSVQPWLSKLYQRPKGLITLFFNAGLGSNYFCTVERKKAKILWYGVSKIFQFRFPVGKEIFVTFRIFAKISEYSLTCDCASWTLVLNPVMKLLRDFLQACLYVDTNFANIKTRQGLFLP